MGLRRKKKKDKNAQSPVTGGSGRSGSTSGVSPGKEDEPTTPLPDAGPVDEDGFTPRPDLDDYQRNWSRAFDPSESASESGSEPHVRRKPAIVFRIGEKTPETPSGPIAPLSLDLTPQRVDFAAGSRAEDDKWDAFASAELDKAASSSSPGVAIHAPDGAPATSIVGGDEDFNPFAAASSSSGGEMPAFDPFADASGDAFGGFDSYAATMAGTADEVDFTGIVSDGDMSASEFDVARAPDDGFSVQFATETSDVRVTTSGAFVQIAMPGSPTVTVRTLDESGTAEADESSSSVFAQASPSPVRVSNPAVFLTGAPDVGARRPPPAARPVDFAAIQDESLVDTLDESGFAVVFAPSAPVMHAPMAVVTASSPSSDGSAPLVDVTDATSTSVQVMDDDFSLLVDRSATQPQQLVELSDEERHPSGIPPRTPVAPSLAHLAARGLVSPADFSESAHGSALELSDDENTSGGEAAGARPLDSGEPSSAVASPAASEVTLYVTQNQTTLSQISPISLAQQSSLSMELSDDSRMPTPATLRTRAVPVGKRTRRRPAAADATGGGIDAAALRKERLEAVFAAQRAALARSKKLAMSSGASREAASPWRLLAMGRRIVPRDVRDVNLYVLTAADRAEAKRRASEAARPRMPAARVAGLLRELYHQASPQRVRAAEAKRERAPVAPPASGRKMEGDYLAAIQRAPAAVAPVTAYAHFLLSECNDVGAAEKMYALALSMDGRDVTALNNYATLCHLVTQRLDRAEDLYLRCLDVAPNHRHALANYAAFLHTVRCDYARAETFYQRAVDADAGNASALNNYGSLLFECLHDPKAAEQLFQAAVARKATFVGAMYNLGMLRILVHGDDKGGLAWIVKAIARDADATSNVQFVIARLREALDFSSRDDVPPPASVRRRTARRSRIVRTAGGQVAMQPEGADRAAELSFMVLDHERPLAESGLEASVLHVHVADDAREPVRNRGATAASKPGAEKENRLGKRLLAGIGRSHSNSVSIDYPPLPATTRGSLHPVVAMVEEAAARRAVPKHLRVAGKVAAERAARVLQPQAAAAASPSSRKVRLRNAYEQAKSERVIEQMMDPRLEPPVVVQLVREREMRTPQQKRDAGDKGDVARRRIAEFRRRKAEKLMAADVRSPASDAHLSPHVANVSRALGDLQGESAPELREIASQLNQLADMLDGELATERQLLAETEEERVKRQLREEIRCEVQQQASEGNSSGESNGWAIEAGALGPEAVGDLGEDIGNALIAETLREVLEESLDQVVDETIQESTSELAADLVDDVLANDIAAVCTSAVAESVCDDITGSLVADESAAVASALHAAAVSDAVGEVLCAELVGEVIVDEAMLALQDARVEAATVDELLRDVVTGLCTTVAAEAHASACCESDLVSLVLTETIAELADEAVDDVLVESFFAVADDVGLELLEETVQLMLADLAEAEMEEAKEEAEEEEACALQMQLLHETVDLLVLDIAETELEDALDDAIAEREEDIEEEIEATPSSSSSSSSSSASSSTIEEDIAALDSDDALTADVEITEDDLVSSDDAMVDPVAISLELPSESGSGTASYDQDEFDVDASVSANTVSSDDVRASISTVAPPPSRFVPRAEAFALSSDEDEPARDRLSGEEDDSDEEENEEEEEDERAGDNDAPATPPAPATIAPVGRTTPRAAAFEGESPSGYTPVLRKRRPLLHASAFDASSSSSSPEVSTPRSVLVSTPRTGESPRMNDSTGGMAVGRTVSFASSPIISTLDDSDESPASVDTDSSADYDSATDEFSEEVKRERPDIEQEANESVFRYMRSGDRSGSTSLLNMSSFGVDSESESESESEET